MIEILYDPTNKIINFDINSLDESICDGILSDLKISSRQVDITIENQQYYILRWLLDHGKLPDDKGINLLFDNNQLDLLMLFII